MLMLAPEDMLEFEELSDVSSYNHSIVQANLAFLLKRLGQYSVSTDLSLNVHGVVLENYDLRLRDEIKPDVCIYPKRKMNPVQDILRMSEMPLLAIEILSPRQGLQEILEKFRLYFDLGIESCWLIIPNTQTVTVYSAFDQFHNYISGNVIDEQLKLQLPLDEIFE